MGLLQLSGNDLRVGEALPWPVYDKRNRLLFKKGAVIDNQKQLTLLLTHGLYRKEERAVSDHDERVAVADPFQQKNDVVLRLRKVFEAVFAIEKTSDVQARVYRLCERIGELCEQDADAVLGALHLDHTEEYHIIHPLHSALLCYLIGKRLGYASDRCHSLMAAALTSNVGMIDLHSTLQSQTTPLTEYQRERIRAHPEEGVDLLRTGGVSDDLWLDIVLQHHERKDGGGYPLGVSGDEFIEEARIVALSDRYHAMVSTRAYRRSMPPTEALKQLFVDRGKEVDERLAQLFIKELGVYPPGSFVLLTNGEIAVVTRRGEDKTRPTVKALINNKGQAYMSPLTRRTEHGEYAVAQLAQPKQLPHLNLMALWDY